jgi:hypothetical protein
MNDSRSGKPPERRPRYVALRPRRDRCQSEGQEDDPLHTSHGTFDWGEGRMAL